MTTTLVTFPSSTTDLNFAPNPSPTTFKSGGELYSFPLLWTKTLMIFPSSIIGLSWQLDPFFTEIFGLTCKFKMSDPYPEPGSYK